MRNRRGFTIAELLVVLSVVAVILPMAGGTVFVLLRAQSRSAETLRDAMAITQLSHSFRTDAHDAQSARLAAPNRDNDGVILDLGGSRTIEFRTEPDGFVTRIVRHNDKVEGRERFRVGSAVTKFAIAEAGKEVAITISPRMRGIVVTNETVSPPGIRIAAILGRNRSLAVNAGRPTHGPQKTPPKARSPQERKRP